jgi:hypothetical protein
MGYGLWAMGYWLWDYMLYVIGYRVEVFGFLITDNGKLEMVIGLKGQRAKDQEATG